MKSGYTFLGFIQNPDVGEDTLPLLYRGTKGYHVTLAHGLLNQSAGYGLTEDGIFGANTEKAVRDYQSKHKLVEDGVIGESTWLSLNQQSQRPTGVVDLTLLIDGTKRTC